MGTRGLLSDGRSPRRRSGGRGPPLETAPGKRIRYASRFAITGLLADPGTLRRYERRRSSDHYRCVCVSCIYGMCHGVEQGKTVRGLDVTPEMIAIIGVGVAIISATLPYNLYLIGQVANLRERMARIEGLFEGSGRQPQT